MVSPQSTRRFLIRFKTRLFFKVSEFLPPKSEVRLAPASNKSKKSKPAENGSDVKSLYRKSPPSLSLIISSLNALSNIFEASGPLLKKGIHKNVQLILVFSYNPKNHKLKENLIQKYFHWRLACVSRFSNILDPNLGCWNLAFMTLKPVCQFIQLSWKLLLMIIQGNTSVRFVLLKHVKCDI